MDWYAHDAWVLGTGKKSQGWDTNHYAFPTLYREVVGPHMLPPASQVTYIHSSRCAVGCKKQRLTISNCFFRRQREVERGEGNSQTAGPGRRGLSPTLPLQFPLFTKTKEWTGSAKLEAVFKLPVLLSKAGTVCLTIWDTHRIQGPSQNIRGIGQGQPQGEGGE